MTTPLTAALGIVLSLFSASGIVPESLVPDLTFHHRPSDGPRANVPDNARLEVAQSPRSALARGVALLEAGAPEAAIPQLEKAFGTPLDDFAHVNLGRALLAADRAAEAVPHFAAVRGDPASPWRPLAARLHPEALRAAGDLRAAIRSFETLLDRYAELPDRPVALLHLAETRRDRGDVRREAETLAELVWTAPDAAVADTARSRLVELRAARVKVPAPTFGDYIDRAALYRRDRRFDRAHADLDAALALAGRSGMRRGMVRDARIATWERAMDWEAVIETLLPQLEKRPEQSPEEALLLVTALRRSGRVEEGLTILERLARKTRHVSKRDLAEAYLQEGRLEEADAIYARIDRRKRGRPTRSFDVAWTDYRLGRLDAAVEGFENVANRRRGRSAMKPLYWHGRALMDAGRTDEAVAVFQQVAAADPRDYYAYQARSRLLDLGHPDEDYAGLPARLGANNRELGGRAGPSSADIGATPSPSIPGPDVLARVAEAHGEVLPRLPRAAQLMEMGRTEDARHELRLMLAEIDWVRAHPRAVSRLIGRPVSPFLDRRREPLGVWGENLDDPDIRRKLRRADWKAERARLVAVRDLPRETYEDLREAFRVVQDPWGVRRVTFKLEWYSKGVPNAENRAHYMDTNPLAWRDAVEREAAANGLDPAFVWAIMTVESAYNETAHSVANARGLLQLLPRTAWLVARDLGDPAPHPVSLLDPARNVRYGTWYLSQLVERFQGQEILAAAAYNAGPHRIAWRIDRVAHLPFDVVLDDLPQWAGREYAKKVLGYIGHYRRVYLDDPVVYIGQSAQPSVPGINY